ncbi:MAG TPA: UDP-2,4-diacetamido-2,4,6-trideoxy-beta-L-altropyranose hydrolase [candidate division Zixibacteria bacterium]|nr:UDP-2,4-diacetamido-2,4,6-trideoxy-beta-L-altropyranose hydrolase [candidate division Zixibacteria bacterium]
MEKPASELPILVLRADADPGQGSGHVMRILALAHAWRERGGTVHFVSVRPAPPLLRRMERAGARVTVIDHPSPARGDLDATRALVERVGGGCRPWVVLDGYHFSSEYQRELRSTGCRLLAIDDNAHLARYHADIVLNYGLHAPRLEYCAAADCWRLLGTRYALLRPEFAAWRRFVRTTAGAARKVLVTLGGADADNVSAKVISALGILSVRGLEAEIVTGPLNPNLEALRQAAASIPGARVRADVADLAPMMAWADVAVAAGGSTVWELAFLQTPALLLELAPNQAAAAAALAEFGAADFLGPAEELSAGDIAACLDDLLHDPRRRRRMAVRGRVLVDGLGTSRVVAAMEERERAPRGELLLRRATASDALLLWQWVNDPVTRRNSLSTKPVPWNEHQAWYSARLASPDCRIWILQAGELPVGQVRYERTGAGAARLSFSVAPGFRGRSFGTRLLESTCEQAARELGARWIEAVALADNEASRRALLKAGFLQAGQKTVAGRLCVVFRRSAGARSMEQDHARSC